MDIDKVLARCAKAEELLNKAGAALKLLPADDDDVGLARLDVLKAKHRLERVRKRHVRKAKQRKA